MPWKFYLLNFYIFSLVKSLFKKYRCCQKLFPTQKEPTKKFQKSLKLHHDVKSPHLHKLLIFRNKFQKKHLKRSEFTSNKTAVPNSVRKYQNCIFCQINSFKCCCHFCLIIVIFSMLKLCFSLFWATFIEVEHLLYTVIFTLC